MSIYILLCLEPLILALKIAEISINIKWSFHSASLSLCIEHKHKHMHGIHIVKSLFAVKLIIKV